MNLCIFCKIINDEAESSLVYQDDMVSAFMDIQPVNPGHLLIIPNKHAAYLENLDYEVGGHIFQIGHKLSQALRKSDIKCEGVNLFLADGEAAFQEVFYVHLHVIPRFVGDGFRFIFDESYFQLPLREELNFR
ncbi:MAG: HIT family protein [Candidatus Kariarchaeaceae archaeon]|jgi:histidine triad (HIT) family protein